MKKVTMQEIADALNISRVTVWKVFNDYPGVSDTTRSMVIEKSKELGYTNAPLVAEKDAEESDNVSKPITISVVVSRPESSLFWMNIIHHIARTLTSSNINMMYTYIPSQVPDDYELPDILLDDTISGIVVLNIYEKKILEHLNRLSIPKVYLDMIPDLAFTDLSGDLFLLEGKASICRITEYILDHGRQNIGFIGDIHYAVTNADRYEGFLDAMKRHGAPVNSKWCLTHPINIHTYQEDIFHFLSSLDTLPDAFVCVSDYVANFVLDYFKEKGFQVPKDIALSGYDGSREYANLSGNLTTVPIDVSLLGERLATQLIYRMRHPNAPKEVIRVYSEVSFNESTDF